MLTFKNTLITMAVAIIISGRLVNSNLYEGSPCKLPKGELGVCTKMPECTSIVNGLKTHTIAFKNIVQCSFLGDTIVICCPDRMPTNIQSTTSYTPTFGGFVFYEKDDEEVYSTPPTRNNARKVILECDRYKESLIPRFDFHIIDGEPTKLGEFPHMAGIGYREFDTDEYSWDCGGSLISNRHILTAAHCCDNPKRKPKIVRLGKTTIRTNDDGAEAVDVLVLNIISHPDYRSSLKYHDIALIILATIVDFNNNVSPACLYTSKDDLDMSVIVVATGWGVDNIQNRTQSNFLLKVNLTSNALNKCNKSYYEYGFTRQYSSGLIQGQMCAFDPKLNKDTCQGDSGSPLQVVNYTSQLSTIVGLTSFGIGCASAIPSVYTRVAFYLDWIESIVWP